MALFKILKGSSADLGAATSDNSNILHEGWAYLTTDTHDLYVDIENDGEIQLDVNRIPVGKVLRAGASSSTTAATFGPTASTASAVSSVVIPQLVVDKYGTIKDISSRTYTINNTDTKVAVAVSNTTQFYLNGSTSASAHTATQYQDTGVYVTTTAG